MSYQVEYTRGQNHTTTLPRKLGRYTTDSHATVTKNVFRKPGVDLPLQYSMLDLSLANPVSSGRACITS